MTVTQTGRNIALVGLLAMVAALLPLTAANAQLTAVDTQYIVADNGEDGAIKHSRLTYTPLADAGPDNPTTEVLIGTADTFADNLAAGAISGQALAGGRPLFLNSSTDGVSDEILAEIARVTTGTDAADVTVHILGGENAQGAGVATALEDAGYATNRFAGATRIETAIAIAEATDNTTVLVVRAFPAADAADPSQAFADSITAGALASTLGYDIVFTQTEVLTGSTAAYLAEAGYESAIVVGGEAAISAETFDSVAALIEDTTRVAGDTRFDTQIAVNELRDGVGPFAIVVDGQGEDAWQDAVSAANWSGLANAPVVLSNQGNLPQQTEDYLNANHENAGTAAFAAHGAANFAFCGFTVTADLCGTIAALQGGGTSEFDPPAPPAPENPTGVITENNGDDSYDYTDSVSGESVTQAFDVDDDNFTVDGVAATSGVFEAALSAGDQIEIVDNGDGTFTHNLTNVNASDILSGTVGNVDGTGFDIIDAASGVALNPGLDYTGGLLTVDGSPVTEATALLNVSEGDTVDITGDDEDEFSFTNGTVTGVITVTASAGGEVALMIGNLGDDHNNGDDSDFIAELTPAGNEEEVYMVGGSTVDFYDGGDGFADQVSSGDMGTYEFSGGTETFTLENAAPPLVEGIVTSTSTTGFDSGADTFTILQADGTSATFTYTSVASAIIYDGLLTEVTAFETAFNTAINTGDMVAYQAPDAATSTNGSLIVDNANVGGWVDNFVSANPSTIDLRTAAGGNGALLGLGVELDDLNTTDLAGNEGFYAGAQANVRYFDATGDSTVEVDEQGAEDLLDERDDDGDDTYVSIVRGTLSTNVTFSAAAPS